MHNYIIPRTVAGSVQSDEPLLLVNGVRQRGLGGKAPALAGNGPDTHASRSKVATTFLPGLTF